MTHRLEVEHLASRTIVIHMFPAQQPLSSKRLPTLTSSVVATCCTRACPCPKETHRWPVRYDVSRIYASRFPGALNMRLVACVFTCPASISHLSRRARHTGYVPSNVVVDQIKHLEVSRGFDRPGLEGDLGYATSCVDVRNEIGK